MRTTCLTSSAALVSVSLLLWSVVPLGAQVSDTLTGLPPSKRPRIIQRKTSPQTKAAGKQDDLRVVIVPLNLTGIFDSDDRRAAAAAIRAAADAR